MDPPSSIPTPRSSGIPRPTSRLPVLRSSGSQSQLRSPASTEQLRKKPSVSSISKPQPSPSVQKKPSRTSLVRPSAPTTPAVSAANTGPNRAPLTSTTKRASAIPAGASSSSRLSFSNNASTFKKPIGRPPSSQKPAPEPAPTSGRGQDEDVLGDLNGFRSASRASSRAGFREDEPTFEDDMEPARPPSRGSQPSLSDRTIESLSHIPSSPAPGKGRRRSSFFNNSDNSMPPPPRPGSGLGNGRRPTSSDGPSQTTPATPRRLASFTQRGSMTAPGKRSVSDATPTTSTATPSKPSSISRPHSTVKKPPLSQIQNLQDKPKARPLSGSKTMAARTPTSRPSLAGTFGQAISPPESAATSPSAGRGPAIDKGSEPTIKVSASSTALREQIAKAKAARRSDVSSKPSDSVPKTNGSSALREQIAKAKEAARRANTASESRTSTPPRDAIVPDPAEIAEFDFGLEDPFNQRPKGTKSLLRKRIDGARVQGRLNIAALGLEAIPDDVLNMYKYDPNDQSIAWGELVDLTTIVAADNELESLPDSMFPDIDMENVGDNEDETPQFGGVQNLDLHGNLLRELPMGLRHLTQLSRLNLSRNKLPLTALDVISQVATLRELKLAENNLKGDLPMSLSKLVNLEVLELQENKLSSLPADIRELTHLQTLNVSDNKLSSLPVELFASVPIVELIASKNSFKGSFFSVDTVPHLQNLQISANSLTFLCESETVSLPALRHLDVSANRLTSLPDVSSWTNLTTMLAGENKLICIPDGFISLTQLRIADFTANDITRLDEKIALMESLDNFTVAANPIRERKFLTMNTEDIKRDLLSRLGPSDIPEDLTVVEANESTGPHTEWTLKPSGTLDLSFQNLTEVDDQAIVAFSECNNIRQMNLQQNYLTSIPPIASELAHLTMLDLSKNNITIPLSEPLDLPKLRELRLNGNKMASLGTITSFLCAPALQHLDVSNNRISGSLPSLRDTFPELLRLMASDNKISEVSAESLEGLKAADISNNDIAKLEPKIGLHAGTLTSFSVEGNKFRVPNYAILKKGTEATLDWLRDRVPSPTEEFFSAGSPTS